MGTAASAAVSRSRAASWCPSNCSTPAHAQISGTRTVVSSPEVSSMLSVSAARLSSKLPVAACEPASAVSRPMRSAGGAEAGRSSSAAENHRAALTGARLAAAFPASLSSATACTSPCCADCATWCARAATGALRASSASALRRCAVIRAPAGHDSYTARRTSGWRNRNRRGTCVERTMSRAISWSSASRASPSVMPAAAAASSSSNGSPATAAPSARPRPSGDRPSSSSTVAAATAAGTPSASMPGRACSSAPRRRRASSSR